MQKRTRKWRCWWKLYCFFLINDYSLWKAVDPKSVLRLFSNAVMQDQWFIFLPLAQCPSSFLSHFPIPFITLLSLPLLPPPSPLIFPPSFQSLLFTVFKFGFAVVVIATNKTKTKIKKWKEMKTNNRTTKRFCYMKCTER